MWKRSNDTIKYSGNKKSTNKSVLFVYSYCVCFLI